MKIRISASPCKAPNYRPATLDLEFELSGTELEVLSEEVLKLLGVDGVVERVGQEALLDQIGKEIAANYFDLVEAQDAQA